MSKLKRAALNGVMKALAHPAVGRLMSDPRMMNALTRIFDLNQRLGEQISRARRQLAHRLHLATRDEVAELSRKLERIEASISSLSDPPR